MKMQRSARGGFTLIEIMIVVAIIGLLAAIAIPNYTKARERVRMNVCICNLKQIEGAKEQWALEKKAGAGSPSNEKEINEYIKGGLPKCPSSGTYTYGPVDSAPICSVVGHVL